jgi:16S rRNA (cytidine1402-2'-O)-methyltransferase
MKKPALLLLPNLIGDQKHHELFLPQSVDKAVATLDGLIAESEGGGRRYLGRFQTKMPPHLIPIALLNKHTLDDELDFLLEPIRDGERWGLVTDAGLPCIADPGARLVKRARQTGIQIQAFVGPCSFIQALMLSGFSGQQFSFHGYLDRNDEKRRAQILDMERKPGTQIFMETPYRNTQLLETLLELLSPDTWLSIAWELTLPDQGVVTQPVSVWKKTALPNLDKKNAVFLIA